MCRFMMCLAVACMAVTSVCGVVFGQANRVVFDLSKPKAEYSLGSSPKMGCPATVSVRCPPWLLMQAGYCPITVIARPVAGATFLTSGTLTVRLQLAYYGSDRWSGVVELPIQAGESQVTSELSLNTFYGDRNMEFTCDWNGVRLPAMGASAYAFYSNNSASTPKYRLVVMSRETSDGNTDRIQARNELATGTSPISMHSVHTTDDYNPNIGWSAYFADVTKLPRNWLHVSAFDEIAIELEDLRLLDADALQCLNDYAWCGGRIVVGSVSNIDELQDLLNADRARTLDRNSDIKELDRAIGFRQAGLGAIGFSKERLGADGGLPESRSASGPKVQATTEMETGGTRFDRLAESLGSEYWMWMIPEVGRTPVWTFFAFVVLVVGIVCPAILIWSQRVKRRVWIVLSIPTLAILSTVLLFAYGAYKDGWETKARIRSWTMIDGDGDGACWSRQTYFAGNVPNNRVSIGLKSEMIPLRTRSGLQQVQLQDDEVQVYEGLVPLRQQCQFSITHPVHDLKLFARSQAIDSVLGERGLINNLEERMLGAVYCNRQGSLFFADEVEPGQPLQWVATNPAEATQTLMKLHAQEPLESPPDAPDPNARNIFDIFRFGFWTQPVAVAEHFPEEILWRESLKEWGQGNEGRFVVFVDGASHVERLLPKSRERRGLHAIAGQMP